MKPHRIKQVKYIITVILVFLLTINIAACGSKTPKSYTQVLDGIDKYFRAEGGIDKSEDITMSSWYRPGDSLTDWIILSELRQGIQMDTDKYLDDITAYINECYKDAKKLDRVKATEWHRISLAVLLSGGDPTEIGRDSKGNPINLVSEGVFNWDHTDELDTQGSNALIYALILLRAGQFDVPSNAMYSEDKIIDMLLSYQDDSGAFGLINDSPDVDITAMAIQGLAPYYEDENVKTSIDSAIDYLSKSQRAGGYYAFGNRYSSDTCSQVILALTSLGIDPRTDERFKKSGVSLAEALMTFRNDDGGFAPLLQQNGKPEESDMLATRQAACAITSIVLLDKGDGDYFDFSNKL